MRLNCGFFLAILLLPRDCQMTESNDFIILLYLGYEYLNKCFVNLKIIDLMWYYHTLPYYLAF